MKTAITFFTAVFFALCAAPPAAAQTPASAPEWVRYASDDGEFSIEMPAGAAYFYDRDGFEYQSGGTGTRFTGMQTLGAAAARTVFGVEIYKMGAARRGLEVLLEKQRLACAKIANLPEAFVGRECALGVVKGYGDRPDAPVAFVARYFASKTHLYVVTAASRGARTAALERFLGSLRLGAGAGGAAGALKISSLKALTVEDLGADETGRKPAPPSDGVPAEKSAPSPTPVLILAKPFVDYPSAARDAGTTGTVRLRVTFEKDGRVSRIAVLSGLPYGINRSAFFAALRIKFIPLEKDGAFETVTKPVEYSFSIGR